MPIVKNKLVNDASEPQEGVTATITLVVTGPAYTTNEQIVTTKVAVTNITGVWSADLIANSLITPGGTHYSVITDLPGDTAQTFIVPDDNLVHDLVDLLS